MAHRRASGSEIQNLSQYPFYCSSRVFVIFSLWKIKLFLLLTVARQRIDISVQNQSAMVVCTHETGHVRDCVTHSFGAHNPH